MHAAPFILIHRSIREARSFGPIEMTLQRSPLEIEAILVGNPSMTIDATRIVLGNEDFPSVYGLFPDVYIRLNSHELIFFDHLTAIT